MHLKFDPNFTTIFLRVLLPTHLPLQFLSFFGKFPVNKTNHSSLRLGFMEFKP